ncbi:amino acid permease [Genlisea aurea]|uniref:Amino acid permease n=1 Tax=Genlisea aurea TaxID=192259 RepID=S8CYC9_9LAMI|nr:amino acid permease [Genlisea aurea]
MTTGEQRSLERTGTIWTAVAHVITGIIGAGVLSLGWSVAQLGWALGPISILVLAIITQIGIFLVIDCYKAPDPVAGPDRNRSFLGAVNYFLGKRQERICCIFVMVGFYGCGIAYTIVTSSCVRAILRSDCYHKLGHNADCSYGGKLYMLLFGLAQIVVSQIPGFHEMTWLSVIAAAMSFTYASIGAALGLATAIENREIKGSLWGVSAKSTPQKVWLVFQALGDISFAYPYTQIVPEIQDTLKASPPENKTMKKASIVSMLITTFFYLCCGCFGYAAFGDDTPGNLLTGFGFYDPYWLVDFANACVILHLIGSYQVYSQPVFAFAENWAAEKYPESKLVNKFHTYDLPLLPRFHVNAFRLCFRTLYVASTTGVAMIFPYFNQVLGFLGALTFWPIAVYYPMEMYFVQKKIEPWTRKWYAFSAFSLFGLVITIVGLIGSVEGLVTARFFK